MDNRFDNNISRNPNYTNKSNITRKQLDKWKVPKSITVKQVQTAFDKCKKETVITGVDFNTGRQRHTNYVEVRTLLYKTRDLFWKKK
ncbi:MAG: hypothetical protein IJB98_03630 [Clostridia bacterium]|nr:hypothetical protein [Clostridia bacterium]